MPPAVLYMFYAPPLYAPPRRRALDALAAVALGSCAAQRMHGLGEGAAAATVRVKFLDIGGARKLLPPGVYRREHAPAASHLDDA